MHSSPSKSPEGSPLALVAVASVELVAMVLWVGGLVVLGAIVAPTVFRGVPAPTSADVMTLVFRKFDRIAMGSSAVALLAEGLLSRVGGRVLRLDLARAFALVVAALFAIAVGAHYSPTIAELHAHGAIRGLGEDGLALERAHRMAETLAKAQLGLVLGALIALVAKLTRRPHIGGT